MSEQTKNMLIGLFVIAACSLVVALILFLKPDVGDGKKTLHVRFSNISKLNVGTRVLYAGKPVGEVVAVQEIAQARDQPVDALGRFYFYELTLRLDSSVVVYDSDQINIQTSGLLGEKSIAITPRPSPKGTTAKEISEAPIYADAIDPIENAVNQLSNVSNSITSTLQEVNTWMKTYGHDTGRAIQNFGASMKQIDTAVQQLHEQNTFVNAGGLVDNLKTISQNLSEGKGTVGKILQEEGLYVKADAVLSRIETMMNDINHYGVLFHMNKGWQRLRMKRMNAFGEASSPQDYAHLFQTELDQINTSMTRLSMISTELENTKLEMPEWSIDKHYLKEFSDLLERSKSLTDHLKLFNEQLSDQQ